MNSKMHIVLCCDDLFAQHAGVLMQSICAHTPNAQRLHFHIFNWKISFEKVRMLQSIATKAQASISIVDIDVSLLKHLHISNRYTPVIYARLLLDRLLPESVTRCIYLDCDMVVTGDIAQLWATDLQGQVVGAVPDLGVWTSSSKRALKRHTLQLSASDVYFNSGLLLIDVAKWRALELGPQALALAQQGFRAHDQDVLNVMFKGNRYHRLPLKWNVMPAIYGFNLRLWWMRAAWPDLKQARRSPAIIHYAGRYKPWEFRECIFNRPYYNALKQTPFYEHFSVQKTKINRHKSAQSEIWRIRLGNLFYG